MDPEAAEVAGWADLGRAVPPALGAARRVEALALPGASCLGVGSLPRARLLNHAVGLRDAAGPDAADRMYRALGATYWVAVRPDGAEGPVAALADRGFAPDGSWVSSPAASIHRPRPRRTCASPSLGPAAGEAFGAIAAGAFGLPDDLAGWIAALVGRRGWHCSPPATATSRWRSAPGRRGRGRPTATSWTPASRRPGTGPT